MDQGILDGLKGFDRVWERVQASRGAANGKVPPAKLMPRKDQPRRGSRLLPPG